MQDMTASDTPIDVRHVQQPTLYLVACSTPFYIVLQVMNVRVLYVADISITCMQYMAVYIILCVLHLAEHIVSSCGASPHRAACDKPCRAAVGARRAPVRLPAQADHAVEMALGCRFLPRRWLVRALLRRAVLAEEGRHTRLVSRGTRPALSVARFCTHLA